MALGKIEHEGESTKLLEQSSMPSVKKEGVKMCVSAAEAMHCGMNWHITWSIGESI